MKHAADRTVWLGIKLLLMAYCYYVAVSCCKEVQKTAEIVTVPLAGEPLSAKAAAEVLAQEEEQEDALYTCFWGSLGKQNVSCEETGKSSRVPVVVTKGNTELVMQGTAAVTWREDGCCIDSETAVELFGTADANGQQLGYGGRVYTVCGVFESLQSMMIRQAAGEDETCLDTAALWSPDAGGDYAEQFLLRHGLEGEQISFAFWGVLAEDFLLLLPVLLGAGLIRFLIGCGKAAPEAGKKAASFALAALILLALLWLLKARLRIPRDMIPSKWSDFSFWSDWWRGQRQNLFRILVSPQGEAQLALLWNLLLSFFCNILAVFLAAGVQK